MSKARSRTLYLIGLGVVILAGILLVVSLIGSPTTSTTQNGVQVTQVTSIGNPVLFGISIFLFFAGGIISFIAYIGALIRLAQLGQWVWFVFLLLFSGITMLLYIFIGPETRSVPQPPTYAPRG
jgi:hypothetical protein